MTIKYQLVSGSFRRMASIRLMISSILMFANTSLVFPENLNSFPFKSATLNVNKHKKSGEDFEKIIHCNPTYKAYYTHVKISWNECPNAILYHVYYLGEKGNLIKLGTFPKGNTYCLDTSIKDGEERIYVVYASGTRKEAKKTRKNTAEAKDKSSVGAKRDKVIALETPKPYNPILDISKGEVTLSWPKVKDATYYSIEIFRANRSLNSNNGESLIIGIQSSKMFFSKKNIYKYKFDPNYQEVYFYRLRAENATSTSTYSSIRPFSPTAGYFKSKSIVLKYDNRLESELLSCNSQQINAWSSAEYNDKFKYANKNTTYKLFSTPRQLYSKSKLANISSYDKYLPRIWTIVIGIEEYEALPRLSYSVQDALKIHNFFKQCKEIIPNSTSSYILTDRNATREKIFSRLSEVTKNANNEDYIILYFSGHGNKNVIFPVNSNGKDKAIYFHEIEDEVNKSRAKHNLIMLDACYSGWPQSEETKLSRTRNLKPKSTTFISSSQLNQPSIEDGRLKASVFTYFLLDGLQGRADDNADKEITVNELFQYVTSKVTSYTLGQQTPTISSSKLVDFPLQINCSYKD